MAKRKTRTVTKTRKSGRAKTTVRSITNKSKNLLHNPYIAGAVTALIGKVGRHFIPPQWYPQGGAWVAGGIVSNRDDLKTVGSVYLTDWTMNKILNATIGTTAAQRWN